MNIKRDSSIEVMSMICAIVSTIVLFGIIGIAFVLWILNVVVASLANDPVPSLAEGLKIMLFIKLSEDTIIPTFLLTFGLVTVSILCFIISVKQGKKRTEYENMMRNSSNTINRNNK